MQKFWGQRKANFGLFKKLSEISNPTAILLSLVVLAHSSTSAASFFDSLSFLPKVFSQTTPYADTSIEGEIVRVPGKTTVYVLLAGRKTPLPIRSAYRETQSDLEHLESGDYILGRGEIISRTFVSIETLELIGIKKILGRWNERSKKSVFHFQNFNTLAVEQIRNGEKFTEYVKYRLAPDEKDMWTIFLAEQEGVHLGHLKYIKNNIRMELIDVSTGEVIQSFDLDALGLSPKP
jgi:hypothetical protein